ncbi:NBS-LRR type resistance protein [Cucumis melo var. makuwa]|uniref:NBS-LRR type resistance protein n=1 Tax=Cucumis melo var. makuwa TaxID=1194695 RepID=A0A5D3DSF6_CUCMM|nr:NBS-LRR type resistance protein [Cucumis melo var. makuwa]
MLTTFKEFRTDCHRHVKKYIDPEEARANPSNVLKQSRRTRLLDRSSLTIIAAGQSRFYNAMETHNQMLELQSQPTQRVVSHALGMRHAIRCWIDDQTIQKALVGDPSRRPTKRQKLESVSFRNGTNAKADAGHTRAQQGPPHDP